ncbi:RHS domain-containing protein [Abyssogena phaseoliformis symbiont]|nr:RHS domain-containing protein [Abyssogena phaseoliformis symbiont]
MLHTSIQVYYYHNNHLGTPQALTDKDQTIVWQANYTLLAQQI